MVRIAKVKPFEHITRYNMLALTGLGQTIHEHELGLSTHVCLAQTVKRVCQRLHALSRAFVLTTLGRDKCRQVVRLGVGRADLFEELKLGVYRAKRFVAQVNARTGKTRCHMVDVEFHSAVESKQGVVMVAFVAT